MSGFPRITNQDQTGQRKVKFFDKTLKKKKTDIFHQKLTSLVMGREIRLLGVGYFWQLAFAVRNLQKFATISLHVYAITALACDHFFGEGEI